MIGTTGIIVVDSKAGLLQHIWWYERLDTMLGHVGDVLDAQAKQIGMARNPWIYRHNTLRNTSALVDAAVRAWHMSSFERGETMSEADLRRWLARYLLVKARSGGKKASVYVKQETMPIFDDLCALLEQQAFVLPHLRVHGAINRRMLITLAIIRADALLRRHKSTLFLY